MFLSIIILVTMGVSRKIFPKGDQKQTFKTSLEIEKIRKTF